MVKNFTIYDWTNQHFCEKITLGCWAYSSEVIQQTSEICPVQFISAVLYSGEYNNMKLIYT